MGKISQMKAGMNSLGATGQKSGTQIQQGMTKATTAINTAGNAAVKNAVNFQTMGMGMLNLSTSAVQTYTSISNLARAENRAEAASLGLQRAEDLLARKQLALNKIVESGGKGSREYKLILDEITTATNDLAVKEDKLKIEKEAVMDVYMLFAANLANVGVSSLLLYKAAFADVTKAQIVNSVVTAKNTIATKLNALARWNSSKSFVGLTAASATATGGLVASTFATKAATLATKALNFALGPVGLVIMGISAALVAYETNFGGFKDAVNGFLGIQEDFNVQVDDGTAAIEAQTTALSGQKDMFDKLGGAMQNYIKMQESIAKQTGDPRELLRLAELRARGYSGQPTGINYSGFSTGGTTTQSTGNTAFQSGNNIQSEERGRFDNSIIPTAHGDSNLQVEKVLSTQKPVREADFGKNPFGSIEQRIAFYEQPFPQQRETLMAWIDNTWDMPGTQQAYVDKYWEIFEISNGFTEKKITKIDPQEEMKKLIQSGVPLGSFKPQFAPGYAGTGESIFDFELDNRKMVKDALGVDIGAVAERLTVHESIRLGTIQKQMGKFNAQPTKWITEMQTFVTGKSVAPGAGLMALLEGSGVETGTAEFAVRSRNPLYGQPTGGRTGELLQQIRALGGVNAQGQTSATQMYQLARVYNPRTGRMESPIRASQAFYDRIREQDYQRNSGTQDLRRSAGSIFSGGGISGLSPGQYGRHTTGFSGYISQLQQTTGMIAGQFGTDEISRRELEAAGKKFFQGQHAKSQAVALMFALEAGKIADRRIDRVEKTIALQLGIDFDANSGEGYFTRVGGSKNRPIARFTSTAKPFWEQIREDIGADGKITLPSIKRMESISLAFQEYGSSWTNFNNFAVHKNASEKLGLTEQKIFDIRFDQTRGDRELLNRLRYVEKIEASSSGTSPL
jgi:hypothetical protein